MQKVLDVKLFGEDSFGVRVLCFKCHLILQSVVVCGIHIFAGSMHSSGPVTFCCIQFSSVYWIYVGFWLRLLRLVSLLWLFATFWLVALVALFAILWALLT